MKTILAFFSLGEPVEALVDTAWSCTIYRGHIDLVVTLFQICILNVWEKHAETKPYFWMTLWSVIKWRDINVMETLLLLPVDEILFISSNLDILLFTKKNINGTYLLFSMRKVNEKTEESFPWGRLQCIFFFPSDCSNTENRIVPAFAHNYKQNVWIPNRKGPHTDA